MIDTQKNRIANITKAIHKVLPALPQTPYTKEELPYGEISQLEESVALLINEISNILEIKKYLWWA